ncbi:MAG: hypothetical protein NC416_06375 [Eubacterium sp.]|nr:hypothetical protein [Eubacterium sp.]
MAEAPKPWEGVSTENRQYAGTAEQMGWEGQTGNRRHGDRESDGNRQHI